MKIPKHYKGHLMLFGLFRIRRKMSYGTICSYPPCINSNDILKRHVEQWLQNWCTIKWIETDFKTDPEPCYL